MEERLRDPSVSVITWQMSLVTGLFSVKVDLIQLRNIAAFVIIKQNTAVGFRIRNELRLIKARKVRSLEFSQFSKIKQVKCSCRNTIGYGSCMTSVLQ